MAKGNSSAAQLGANIIIAGLALQLIFFAFFVVVAVAFYRAMRVLRPNTAECEIAANWQRQLKVLYAASGLLIMRNVVRVVEYAQGNGGYLLRHECFLYVFDAVPMVAVMAMWNFWHPSEITAFAKSKNGVRMGVLGEVAAAC